MTGPHVTENILAKFIADELPHVAPTGQVTDPEQFSCALHSAIEAHHHAPQFSPWYRNPTLFRLTRRDGENISVDHARIRVANNEIGTLDREILHTAVLSARENATAAGPVLEEVLGLIRKSMEIADLMTIGQAADFGSRRYRWQDVFTRIVTDTSYREVMESFTVDGEVLIELVEALCGSTEG